MQKEYDFAKGVCSKYANIYTNKTLTLTTTQWKTFANHLKNPNQPTTALKSLMKMKSFDNSK